MMSFTTRMVIAANPNYMAFATATTNENIVNGTLPQDSFRRLLEQDSLYMHTFGELLGRIVKVAPRGKQPFLQNLFDEAVKFELELHESYKKQYGEIDWSHVQPTDACRDYQDHLNSQEDYAAGLGAILPCYLFWRLFGEVAKTRLSDGHPYRDWIAGYTGESFNRTVEQLCLLIDDVAKDHPGQVEAMEQAVLQSAKYEAAFFRALQE